MWGWPPLGKVGPALVARRGLNGGQTGCSRERWHWGLQTRLCAASRRIMEERRSVRFCDATVWVWSDPCCANASRQNPWKTNTTKVPRPRVFHGSIPLFTDGTGIQSPICPAPRPVVVSSSSPNQRPCPKGAGRGDKLASVSADHDVARVAHDPRV